jgi:hypothetical protein
LRLYVFQLIYKVTGPWHAPNCFATHVETRSPPQVLLREVYSNLNPTAIF